MKKRREKLNTKKSVIGIKFVAEKIKYNRKKRTVD